MISIYKNNGISNIESGNRELEYRGLSTDSKPTTNVVNGSVFIEIDTGKIYLFDADSSTWKEV